MSVAFCEHMGKKMAELKRELGAGAIEERLNDFVIGHASQVIQAVRPDYEAVSEAARKIIDESIEATLEKKDSMMKGTYSLDSENNK